jgi:hypothetical protein
LMFLAKPKLFSRNVLSGLSPDALCRIQFNLNNSNFKREVWYSFWRNQKLSLAARSALNLYECAVSASNAD